VDWHGLVELHGTWIRSVADIAAYLLILKLVVTATISMGWSGGGHTWVFGSRDDAQEGERPWHGNHRPAGPVRRAAWVARAFATVHRY